MRVIFAVLCLLAGTAAGLYRSAMLKKRERLLAEIIGLLEQMSVQIKYRAPLLGELFMHFNESSAEAASKFIREVLTRGNDLNWRGAWNEAADSFAELNDGDVEILTSIGNSLGNSDADGQTAMLELNRKLLELRLTEASENAAKKGAMYRSVGVLTGLGLAIVVI